MALLRSRPCCNVAIGPKRTPKAAKSFEKLLVTKRILYIIASICTLMMRISSGYQQKMGAKAWLLIIKKG